MSKEKNIFNHDDDISLSEPNELGWEIVLNHGKLYEKKTIIHDNGTTRVYNPIPWKKKKQS